MSFNSEEELNLLDNLNKLNELIKIGKYYSNKNIEHVKNDIHGIHGIRLNFDTDLQYKLHSYFSKGNRGYSKSELSYILIGTIVGEVYLRGGELGSEHGYGSVTAAQSIIKVIGKESPLRALAMKRWAKKFGFVNHWFYGSV